MRTAGVDESRPQDSDEIVAFTGKVNWATKKGTSSSGSSSSNPFSLYKKTRLGAEGKGAGRGERGAMKKLQVL